MRYVLYGGEKATASEFWSFAETLCAEIKNYQTNSRI